MQLLFSQRIAASVVRIGGIATEEESQKTAEFVIPISLPARLT
jgi:hypothetical protein